MARSLGLRGCPPCRSGLVCAARAMAFARPGASGSTPRCRIN